jgi:hypothetical protein
MERSVLHSFIPLPSVRRGSLRSRLIGAAAACLLSATQLHAVSCTTQAEMKEPTRTSIASTARQLATRMQAADVTGIRSQTLPAVAVNFDRIAATIQGIAPGIKDATLNVTSVYDLQAADAQPGDETVQFFCGEAANGPHVIFNIPRLPAGHFAFAIVEATGVKNPERLSFLLENTGPQNSGTWQLAGLFPRPLVADGHDGVWYWDKARSYNKAGQPWNAYFYYQTAIYLLLPADFVDSNNFDKLIQEQTAATPAGLPGAQPMSLNVAGSLIYVTNIHTDSTFGGYDLVVQYQAEDVSDPVKARARTVALMKQLLVMHPEWKDGFHGLWVFANAPNQQPFSLELSMPQIASQS